MIKTFTVASIILILSFLSNFCFSQNNSTKILKLYNTKTKKEVEIQENSEIKITTNKEKIVSASFIINSDSTIQIASNDYLLSDIVNINYLEKNKKLVGEILILSGAASIIGGILIISNSTSGVSGLVSSFNQAYSGFLLLLTGGVFSSAGTLYIVNSRNHKKSKGWKFEIKWG